MMSDAEDRPLTLDRKTAYAVLVSGDLGDEPSDWFDDSVDIERLPGPHARTRITGTFDQAALQGVIRRVYSLGFPLISVNRIEGKRT